MTTFDPQQLVEWDKAHVWHPFTHMQQYLAGRPLIIERGRGVKLQDVHGRWYFDGTSSIWLNVHGHHVEAINQAIRDQLEQVAHCTLLGQANVPSILLARRLVELVASGLTRVFYSDAGATAVEIALKLAIQYWANLGQRDKRYVLGFTHNYHGDTLGAVSVAYDETFHWPFRSLLPGHPRAPYPYVYRHPTATNPDDCLTACLAETEQILADKHEQLAALIVEPVEGAGGIIPAPVGFLARLRQLCDQYDVLMIVDEVATGFGRTAVPFACHDEGVCPDLLCLGKGLSGGYLPLAATMTTDRVFEAFLGEMDEGKTFFHGHSYTGNPLACAAALASCDLLDELLPALPDKAAYLAELLSPLAEHPLIGDLRQRGFMVGLELVADRATKQSFPYHVQAGYQVTNAAIARGLLIRPIGNVIIFMPPLASTRAELAEMVEILTAALHEATPKLAAACHCLS